MSSLYNTIAGTLDHAAGRTDEATHGVVRGVSQGRHFMAGQDDAGTIDHIIGSVDEAMASGPVDTGLDTLFIGHAGDTIDVLGPSVSEGASTAFDVATTTDAERRRGNTQENLLRYGILVVVGLGVISWVFGPLLEAFSAAAGEEG